MFRIFYGALIGLTVWGFFLLGSDFVWATLSPGWFGAYQAELRSAIFYETPFAPQTPILMIVVVRSAIYSLISGIVTAMVARDNDKSTLLLGTLLLFFGIVIHSFFWDLVPFWFHLSILVFLVPLTMLGGKLITITPRRPRLIS